LSWLIEVQILRVWEMYQLEIGFDSLALV